MKTLLTAVNAKYIHSNLAVYSLKAYAERFFEDISLAEYTINQTFDDILMDIYRQKPDLLCFSCYIWNISFVGQLLEEIPKILPGTEVWLGGPEVSYDAEDVLTRYPMLRGVMCGEGEETFLELVRFYHGEGDGLGTVKGIVYREETGEIRRTDAREIMDLSRVPFVYERIEDFKNRIIYYESSRGCPFSCSYCLSSVDKCLRFRDLELVKKELQFFIDHEVPQVKFVDRTFNCKHSHAMEIWSYIREHDKGITNFHFEVAADLLNEEEIDLIGRMRPGLIQLEIGIQSANPDTITEIRRKMDLDKVREIAEKLRSGKNVHRHLDLIAGLPFEDYESFVHSYNEVYAMRPEQLQLGFLKVLKGSLMHEKVNEYGLVYQGRPPYEVLSTKWISYSDIIRLKEVEEMTEVYYNSAQFRNVMEHLEKATKKNKERCFESAFAMYASLAAYYEQNNLSGISHSRIDRYRILYDFMKAQGLEKEEEYIEWLTLDLYLRDNVKNRPEFLGESKVSKEEAFAFYRAEAEEHRYLKGYEGYEMRQIRKMTHLERIGGKLFVFDYRSRDPLTGDATVQEVSVDSERIEK